jgi:hypothetical protein
MRELNECNQSDANENRKFNQLIARSSTAINMCVPGSKTKKNQSGMFYKKIFFSLLFPSFISKMLLGYLQFLHRFNIRTFFYRELIKKLKEIT